jgi:hypothetical protein
MSRYAANCRWCGDKPGGCLYCIGELADSDAEKLQLIDQAIQSGEVHVLAVRNTQEILLRQVRRQIESGGMVRANPARKKLHICIEHLWAFDAGNFKRRHCTRPGCIARQVFVWLPDSPDKNGEWVDEKNAIRMPLKSARKKTVRATAGKK